MMEKKCPKPEKLLFVVTLFYWCIAAKKLDYKQIEKIQNTDIKYKNNIYNILTTVLLFNVWAMWGSLNLWRHAWPDSLKAVKSDPVLTRRRIFPEDY